ncbi:hypothetical protein H6P81_019490 [Aristolochia fimbriata]|uniref:S phase cyclin A-associated protein in the endoplasmic reticulum N-terminal domain-containing protein n=1 Tax=Aristolochia fimbriata TaxID=158543 RepID=A0AAV7DRU0_ARIFI|nr:hypothetical protein H6P81_019490 [Aristolochia fimbriata]
MENDGDAADDQGWLQVKKRHRSSAKISFHSNLASKARSTSQRNQPSAEEKVTNGNFRRKSLPSRGEGHITSQTKADSGNLCPLTQVDSGKRDVEDKVINQESELHKLSLCQKVNVSVGRAHLLEQASDKIPKIKWGDLEDEVLEGSKNTGKIISAFPSKIVNQEDTVVTRFDGVQQLPDVVASSAVQDESTSEDFNEVNEIPSEDVQLPKTDETIQLPSEGVQLPKTDETIQLPCEDVQLPKTDEAIQPSDDTLAISSEIHCHKEMGVSHSDNSSAGTCISSSVTSSGLPIIHPVGDVAPQEPGALSQENPEPETSGSDSITASGNLTDLQDAVGNACLSKTHLMDALDEDESGESKERFRERLWTFLFGNLNRAVDELYLLCELECDVKQMEEAILVLEEAGSDFKELTSRVKEFEKVRKTPGQLPQDGIGVNKKNDHRRPHALSWEVRRMTTSPHRAEILSSSLEAFKKIQQERASKHSAQNDGSLRSVSPKHFSGNSQKKSFGKSDVTANVAESGTKFSKHTVDKDLGEGPSSGEKRHVEISKLSRGYATHSNRFPPPMALGPDFRGSSTLLKDATAAKRAGDSKRSNSLSDKDKEKEKRSMTSLKSMDAWKEKRNWEDILSSPSRNSSRISHSPAMSRRSAERARVLHDKLMSPEKKKKTALDMKREAEEKHARAMRIRNELENERVQRLQKTSEKLNRVSEWQAVKSLKLREGMLTRHQRSESRHEAHLAQVVKRAGDESSKVNEVRFITSLNEENKKLMLKQKLQDSELRRAEKLQGIKIKQKEDSAREEAVLERRKLLEAEKLQRLAENQRKKEEAQVRREEERKASSAAREARAIEQLRRKEVRAKAQQEEAELLAQKLAERLSESEMRRKFYLEQIKERASMDFRDQSSPSVRRGANKEGMGKLISANSVEDFQANCISGIASTSLGAGDAVVQQSWKRRAKKIRQRLMALKYDFVEPPVSSETAGIGYRTQVGAARAKIARWLQDLQKLRQARKEGAASIGLIVGDMIKFLEGKDPELHTSRQAGLLDFIASALPASHISKPEACQVTIYLLRLLKVVLALPANRGYFIAQNLLPPVIPMLSAALENYIKISATSNLPPSNSSLVSSKISSENLESIAEVLEGFLWTVTVIIGYTDTDECQSQMQDILVELVITYQVIHRLRDLFALFDRPQLEGVPFPSSVLLGLNLLTVLTSRYRFISSIDWGFNPSLSTSEIRAEEKSANNAELAAVGGDSSEKVTAFDVAHFTTKHKEPLSIQKDSYNQLTETSSQLNNAVESSGESHKNKVAENVTTLSRRDEKSKTDDIKEDRNDTMQEAGGLVMHKKVQNDHEVGLKLQVAFVVSAIGETGLVGLPSLLTAVLLQANSKSSSEQGTYLLPSNFEEVATGVLKVLNNLALLDINLLQKMLARPDLRMEFFHLMSFLLSHCTVKWRVATDQVGLLLLETLLLLGYFSLLHPGNQAVLRWGKSPTILHKVCDLPFVFFSDPELSPILAGTLVAACYGSEQNKGVVLQELSMDMLLSLLKSCRQSLTATHSDPYGPENNAASDDPSDVNQPASDSRKLQSDLSARSGRNSLRSSKAFLGKGGLLGSNGRPSKVKNQKESKGTKAGDESALKHNLPSDSSSTFMLHNRFPSSFIDRAQEFFQQSTSL